MSKAIVVGAGNWGKNLVRNFYNLGALAAVAEVNSNLRSAVEADYPDIATYADYQAALETDISAVVLATPAPTHYQMARAALEAGKDVFVEKPIALRAQGGQTAHIHSSWYWPLLQRSTVVVAEKQMPVYDEVLQKVTIYDKGVDDRLNNRDDGSQTVEVAASEPLKNECQHFLDCIKNRQRPRSDGWNGVAVVEILEKATEALHS